LHISVWGKNGSGKSTVASNLACAFAKDGYKTALVGANRFFGSIQYCFDMEVQPERSLRAALAGAGGLSAQDCLVECPSVKNLSVASLADSDDCAGYRKVRAEMAVRFIKLINANYQCVLIDCDESVEDPLSMYSLTLSSKILYVTRPSFRSVAFAKAYEPIVTGLQIKEQLHVVLIDDGAGGDAALYIPFGAAGGYCVLPYCKEIGHARGASPPLMLTKSVNRASARYRNEMSRLAKTLAANG